MDTPNPLLTGDLARAGRALTQVSLERIAQHAGLDTEQLRSFERGSTELDDGQLLELTCALEHYGVLFFPDDDEGGYGVRRKFTARTVKRVENWENEGGPAYEDDI